MPVLLRVVGIKLRQFLPDLIQLLIGATASINTGQHFQTRFGSQVGLPGKAINCLFCLLELIVSQVQGDQQIELVPGNLACHQRLLKGIDLAGDGAILLTGFHQ